MRLRELIATDAPLMLEWMHCSDVVEKLQADFAHKTLNDCMNFINKSHVDKDNLHLAIVNDDDVYMGTVSLKNIDKDRAEFAITIRKNAMGKGFSKYAMSEMLRMGFEEMNLSSIYWCVSSDNKRAVKFYEKNGYVRVDFRKLGIIRQYTLEQIQNYIWYQVTRP